MRGPGDWSALVACALFALLVAPRAAADEGVEYRWDVVVDAEEATVDVEGVVRVRNDGELPLTRVPLVLYGNRFREVDPAITDITFDRFYAPYFDEGRHELQWVRALDGRPLAVEPGPDEAQPSADAVAVDVVLVEPVEPGAWAELRLAARLHVPKRLGTFGHRGRRLVLEGGWHPWVPARGADGARAARGAPAMASHTVRVRFTPDGDDEAALLEGEPPGDVARVVTTTTPSLAAGPDLARLGRLEGGGVTPALVVCGEPGDEERAARLLRIVEQAAAFARDHLPRDLPVAELELAFVQAPLRDRFVHPTQGPVVLYSDRLFHVVKPLQVFHEVEVGRGAIEALVRLALRDAALGADRDWACEALAWEVTRAWVRDGRAGGLSSGTITGGMRLLDFIPAIDSLLRAPRFVGSDLYYGRIWEPQDAVPDDLSRALSRRPRGRVVTEKLRDLLGDERLAALTGEVLGGRAPLRARAAALAGRDLGPFFALWTGPLPLQNLALDDVEVLEDLPDGGERVRVTIRRDGDPRPGEVGEPVVVETEGPHGEPVRAAWDGLGVRGQVVTTRHGLLYAPITLDPDHRVLQGYRGDDISPALGKLLVNRFNIRLDLNHANRNEAAVGFTIHPFYDYAHAILVDGFWEEDERGLTLGYGYGFGTVIDERTYGTAIGGRLTAEHLSEGVLKDDAGFDETEGTLVSAGASLSFDTRLFQANPTWGFGVDFGYEHSDKTFGTDFRFDLFSVELEAVYSIIRGTQLATEILVGQMIGTDVPTQRLFDAGGENTVRGVESSRFVDRAIIVVRGELRQMLVEDLDVPLLWLAWLRKLQLALFLDAGDVGETIEDVYEARTDWKWGTGIGFRAWLDVFGVNPVVLRFDLGFRIDETDELGPEYYLGVGQSF
jgi:hypothetical protein